MGIDIYEEFLNNELLLSFSLTRGAEKAEKGEKGPFLFFKPHLYWSPSSCSRFCWGSPPLQQQSEGRTQASGRSMPAV